MPRATLSDLLADDVKDYFRREGVNDDNLENGGRSKQRRRRRQENSELQNGHSGHAVDDNSMPPHQPYQQPPHAQISQRTKQLQVLKNDQTQHNQQRSHSCGPDSRNRLITAQDAEFLKRYTEERERASHRDKTVNVAAPKNIIATSTNSSTKNNGNYVRPYHALVASSRPPTVTGSHRPQLPSIDNDDWEEDDRVERANHKKMERRRKKSGLSADHGRKNSGESGHSGHFRLNSNADSVGSGSFVRYQHPQRLWQYSPYESLCYDMSSQHHVPYPRKCSEDTFVRKESDDKIIQTSDYNEYDSSIVDTNERGHKRPLSYLSASSESEQKSEVNKSSHFPSPLSFGTFKTVPSETRYSIRSKDESDTSALWGGSILESPSIGSDKHSEYRTNYIHRSESSSEESYTSSSDESSGFGYNEKDRLMTRRKSYSSIRKPMKQTRRISPLRLDDALNYIWENMWSGLLVLELYISNMPSLVGSLALAWSSLGVDWFKWYEETFGACHPTDYHNKLCTYPEFPGCFTCDTSQIGYQVAIHFHLLCNTISFILTISLIGKIFIAFPVVRDELANPTTAAPLGLLCMAIEKIFGGNFGVVGMSFVFGASALQTVVAIWFIFISIVYKTLPEPSWFPNTTGLGLAAAKIYLYWSFGGYVLSILSVLLFVMFYFVALYRIHANYKISAPVCWVQISGPAVVLYGVSIFGQPVSDEAELELASSQENIQHFTYVHQKFYMPIMHALFVCCIVSMVSALYCLSVRFKRFKEKEFSPAHVAFCAPILSHSNALQVYRSAVKRFTMLPHDHLFKIFIYRYWTLCLTSGTVLILVMTYKFILHLPIWCKIDIDDDEIPPEPEKTMLTKLLEKGNAKDNITQDYVSAAVLQANESGALVRVLRDGKMRYMRSRRMPSMGFDPIMSTSQLVNERDRLLQHLKYSASLQDRERGTSSFDDTLSSFYERSSSRTSPSSMSSTRRNRRNFMSFDVSAMMRGEHE